MLSRTEAMSACAYPARRGLTSPLLPGALALLAVSLAACQPRTVALAGADPADPTAGIAAVRTSAVTAPYTPLRPAAPAAWGQRNDPVAPRTQPDR